MPTTAKWHRRTTSNPTDAAAAEDGLYSVPTSHEGPGYQVEVPTVTTRRYAVIMVGLPARGKTFLAQKISRYLAWLGHESAVFNVQRMWRDSLGVNCPRTTSTVEMFHSMNNLGSTGTPPDMTPQPSSESPPSPATKKQFIKADTFFQTFAACDDGTPSEYRSAVDNCVSKVRAFYQRGGLVAFINDDFVTPQSREIVEQRLSDVADQVLYVEVIRDDDQNSRFESLKVNNAGEYGNIAGSHEAKQDFAKRIALLKSVYKHVDERKSFIRIKNGSHIYLHNVRGYLPSRMTSFLMHLAPQNKVFCPIYFSRHGQSEYNLEDRLGGNPRLTEQGRNDALALRHFIASVKSEVDDQIAKQREEYMLQQVQLQQQNASPNATSTASTPGLMSVSLTNAGTTHVTGHMAKPMQIWTSQLTRTIETARPSEELGIQCLRWRNLNEIHAGVCEHLTYAEVKERYPLIHDFRKKNKYAFRYPDGESYQDLVTRLEPVIMELENADRVVVVVAHQAVLRALLAYFGGSNAEHSVHVEVPHRTVWRCSYDNEGIPTIDEMKLPDNLDVDYSQQGLHFVPTMPQTPLGVSADKDDIKPLQAVEPAFQNDEPPTGSPRAP